MASSDDAVLDPARCTAGGKGIGGGTALAPVKFTVYASDSKGTKIRRGGARVNVSVVRSGLGGGEVVAAEVDDHGDGTYTCTYAVPSRGDYSVSVGIGEENAPISGSPFPGFFAAAPAAPAAPGVLPGAPGVLPPGMLPPGVIPPGPPERDGAPGAVGVAPGAAATAPAIAPEVAAELQKTLHVGNLAPGVTVEQLRTIFAFCGVVTDCRIANEKAFGFVEYATHEQALAGLGLNGLALEDRPLRVEMSKTVRQIKPGMPQVMMAPGMVHPGLDPALSAAAASVGLAQTPAAAAAAAMLLNPSLTAQQQHQARTLAAQQQQAILLANAAAAAAGKSAAERAAEISRRLNGGGDGGGSKSRSRSRSRSRSPRRGGARGYSRDRGRSRSRSRDRRPYDRRSRSRSRDRGGGGGGSRRGRRRGGRNRKNRGKDRRGRDASRDRAARDRSREQGGGGPKHLRDLVEGSARTRSPSPERARTKSPPSDRGEAAPAPAPAAQPGGEKPAADVGVPPGMGLDAAPAE
jgi:arginine/serine-rich splicing factor 12